MRCFGEINLFNWSKERQEIMSDEDSTKKSVRNSEHEVFC